MNLLTPFRRDQKLDFAHGSGPELLASQVRQVLGTVGATSASYGELPWRTNFGSGVHLLRHKNNTELLAERARTYVQDALKRWMPETVASSVTVQQRLDRLIMRVELVRREVKAVLELPVSQ